MHNFITQLFSFIGEKQELSLEWIEQNQDYIMEKYRECVRKKAISLYDSKITLNYSYRYTPEAYERLKDEVGEENVIEHNFIHPSNGRRIHIIHFSKETTLRELTGDFQWKFSPDGQIRPTDVRYAIKRQLNYLWIIGKGAGKKKREELKRFILSVYQEFDPIDDKENLETYAYQFHKNYRIEKAKRIILEKRVKFFKPFS